MSFPLLFILNSCSLLLLFTFCQVCLPVKETAEIGTVITEKSIWDQANIRQKIGLVWRNRKEISQIIKDYVFLLFFLWFILWRRLTERSLAILRHFQWEDTSFSKIMLIFAKQASHTMQTGFAFLLKNFRNDCRENIRKLQKFEQVNFRKHAKKKFFVSTIDTPQKHQVTFLNFHFFSIQFF